MNTTLPKLVHYFVLAMFSVLFVVLFVWSYENMPMSNLGFGFGPYVESLRSGKFSATYYDSSIPEATDFFASRTPGLPLLAFGLSLFWDNTILLAIFKNVASIILIAWSCYRLTAGQSKIVQHASIFLTIGNLYLWRTIAPIPYEEGYIAAPLLFVLCCVLAEPQDRLRSDPFVAGVSLAWVFLTKASYVFTIVGVLLALIYLHRSRAIHSLIPISLVFLSAICWGGYVWHNTGRFAILSHSSSLNGPNLYKGNNVHFLEFYPYRNLDEMHELGYMDLPRKVKTEWEYHDGFMEQVSRFKRQHPDLFWKGMIEKAKMVFVRLDGAKTNEPMDDALKIDKYFLVNRVIFWLWIALSGLALLSKVDQLMRKIAAIGLGLLVTNALPYIIGFYYHRHLLPTFLYATITTPILAYGFWTQFKSRSSRLRQE